jgi:organic hydroperoxide reductase OsmC/OhrA
MFVGALETCQLLTFLALAKRRNISIVSYSSTANGNLELVNGDFRFTKVIISPVITVDDPVDKEEVLALAHQAHQHCLIANSTTAVIEVHPTVVVGEPEGISPSL